MTPEIIGVFRKSSYSDQQGDCVEIAHTTTGGCVVRDSKNPAYGAQLYAQETWSAFLGALKGEFLSDL